MRSTAVLGQAAPPSPPGPLPTQGRAFGGVSITLALRTQAARKMVDTIVNLRTPRALDLAAVLVPVSDRQLDMAADTLLARIERREVRS